MRAHSDYERAVPSEEKARHWLKTAKYRITWTSPGNIVDQPMVRTVGAPTGVQRLADIVGLEAAMDIIIKLGGSRLNPVANPAPTHELVRLVGWDATVAIHEAFGNIYHVPRVLTFSAQYLRSQGKSVGEITRILRCSERHVYYSCRAYGVPVDE